MSQTAAEVQADAAHFEANNHRLLTIAAQALSAAPHFTNAEKQDRTVAVIGSIMAFLPTEPVQTMFASLAVGTHMSALDGFRELAVCTLTPVQAARARMVGVAQARLMISLTQELRVLRQAHMDIRAEERAARRDAVASAQKAAEAVPQTVPEPPPQAPESPAVPETPPAAEAPVPLQANAAWTCADPADAELAQHAAEFEAALADYNKVCAEAGLTVSPDITDMARQVLETARGIVQPQTPAPAQMLDVKVPGSRAYRRAMMKKRGAFRRTR